MVVSTHFPDALWHIWRFKKVLSPVNIVKTCIIYTRLRMNFVLRRPTRNIGCTACANKIDEYLSEASISVFIYLHEQAHI